MKEKWKILLYKTPQGETPTKEIRIVEAKLAVTTLTPI